MIFILIEFEDETDAPDDFKKGAFSMSKNIIDKLEALITSRGGSVTGLRGKGKGKPAFVARAAEILKITS